MRCLKLECQKRRNLKQEQRMFSIKHGQSQELDFKTYQINDSIIEAALLYDDFIVYGIDRTYNGKAGDYVLRSRDSYIVCFKEIFELFLRSI